MWRSPVRASAPFGLRRGAGANTVGVVVVVALVVNLKLMTSYALFILIINSRFGSKLLAARLPRTPPA